MKKSERCLAILEILQRQHKVKVTDLAQRFGISEMTIRRDLNFLARQYNISRTHGGAELGNQPVVRMISFDEARIAHKETKEKIVETKEDTSVPKSIAMRYVAQKLLAI